MKYTLILSIFCVLLLSACQQTQGLPNIALYPTEDLYLDDVYIKNSDFSVESENEIFALDNEMKAMVKKKLSPIKNTRKKTIKLLEHIFSTENIDLLYENGANVTAREAYHQHTANCMSLTIMAYSLAKEAQLDIYFQEIDIPEYWVRNGKYNMLTGHVNLLVKQKLIPGKTFIFDQSEMEVDFDPFATKSRFPRKIINKNRVIAMYYNNKGAQALINEEYSNAYQYFKAATKKDSTFSTAWGNLGVLYRIDNRDELAKKTYSHALALNDENLTVMGNLAIIYNREKNITLANQIEKVLQKKRNKNPYYHALLGDEAYYKGSLEQALSHYKKAIKMDEKVHEFHFGIAKVYYELAQNDLAKRHLKKAILLNNTRLVENQYIAKLNFLNQLDKDH
jgi:Flp pilus assembly protein TadD